MSPSLNRATFALQSRLFVAMKRAGRVIDLVWFQHNVEYARAVLDTAARMSDDEVRSISENLRKLLHEYLGQGKAAVLPLRPAPAPAPATAPVEAAPSTPVMATDALPPAELDRHLTSLR
jgi:hypothetical protein